MIYLDAVWLLNILMDGMILYLTQGLTRSKSSTKRILLAAFVASTIVPLTIYLPEMWLTSSLGKLMFSLMIIWIAFSYKSVRAFIIQLFTFYFITFAIGGSMLGVHFFLAADISVSGGAVVTFSGGYGDPVSWLFVLVGFPLSWMFTKWRMEHSQVHRMKLEDIYHVTITWEGESVRCQGLVDSGNQLVDPVSRKMVFLADRNVMGQFLSDNELDQLHVEHVVTAMDELSSSIQSSLRLVPYQGAGTGGKLLVTLLVDSISVKTPEGDLVIEQPLVGIQHQDLTYDRLYQMLIHPHIMIKGKSA